MVKHLLLSSGFSAFEIIQNFKKKKFHNWYNDSENVIWKHCSELLKKPIATDIKSLEIYSCWGMSYKLSKDFIHFSCFFLFHRSLIPSFTLFCNFVLPVSVFLSYIYLFNHHTPTLAYNWRKILHRLHHHRVIY